MRNYLTAVLVLFLWLTHGTAQAANMNITVGPNNSETFSPANVTINVGDTITFSYKGGSMPHNAVSKNLFRCAQGCDGAGGDGDASSSSWTSVVTLTTAGTFNYYCEIHGTPTSGMHGTITVNGSAPPPPDFGVSADTPSVSVTQGASATVGVTLAPQNGFNGNVSYAASGLPSGVVASFVNDSATHATMTLASNSSATPGNATVTITATSGSLVHTTSVALSVLASAPTFSITGGITGSWYDPALSGQGFNIEVLPGNTLIAIWYVFDGAGNNLWLSGIGPYGGDSTTLSMSQTTGGAFPPAFDPAKIVRSPWGTLTLQFSDCNTGTATWITTDTTQLNFPNGSMPIKRLTALDTLACP